MAREAYDAMWVLRDRRHRLMEEMMALTTGQLRDLPRLVTRLIRESEDFRVRGDLWRSAIVRDLAFSENSFSLAAERRGMPTGTLRDLALRDMEKIRELYLYDYKSAFEDAGEDVAELLHDYRSTGPLREDPEREWLSGELAALRESFDRAENAEAMLSALADFYARCGAGDLGLYRAFRVEEGRREPVIAPIDGMRLITLDDLVGYEIAKRKLLENTEAFVSGLPANNCLLFGDAGTGKSTSVKALANQFYGRGLRVIELYRHQYQAMNDVIAAIEDRNYYFILYLDDLSFEEFEVDYKYLKAVIEGGLKKRPDNVLIYATSNRRHLIRESHDDRDGLSYADKHYSDTMQEKLSLSGRFGVSVYFESPDMEEYQTIVSELARKNGIEMDPEELRMEATRWEMTHGGLSGRTAQQFIDHLLGTRPGGECED